MEAKALVALEFSRLELRVNFLTAYSEGLRCRECRIWSLILCQRGVSPARWDVLVCSPGQLLGNGGVSTECWNPEWWLWAIKKGMMFLRYVSGRSPDLKNKVKVQLGGIGVIPHR